MRISIIRFIAGTLLLEASVESAVAQRACADLMDLELPYTTITSAATVAEGPIPTAGDLWKHRPRYRSGAMRSAGDHASHEGLRDSNRALAATLRMERKVPTNGQRRLGRLDQSNGAGRPASARLCGRRDRQRSCQRRFATGCHLGYRPSGKTDRFRSSSRARNERSSQGDPARPFWARSGSELLQWLFRWRTRSTHGGAALSRKISRASSPERPPTIGRGCSRGSSGMNARSRRIRFRLPS